MQKLHRVVTADFSVYVLRELSVLKEIVEEFCEGVWIRAFDGADIAAVEDTTGKFVQKFDGVFGITHHRVSSASRGEVAIEIFEFAQEVGKAALRDRALWVFVARVLRIYFGDLAPERLGMTYKLQVGVLFEHFFEARQTEIVNDSVAMTYGGGDVEKNGHAELFANGKKIFYSLVVKINI